MKRAQLRVKRKNNELLLSHEETFNLSKEELISYILENVEEVFYYNREKLFNDIAESEYYSNVEDCLKNSNFHGIVSFNDFVDDCYKSLNEMVDYYYEEEGIYDSDYNIIIPLHDDYILDDEYLFANTISAEFLEEPVLEHIEMEIKWVGKEEIVNN